MIYVKDIAALSRSCEDFRREVHTGEHSQVILMSLPPGEDIGEEVHAVDQIIVITAGSGEGTVGGQTQAITAGDLVFVPAGARHNFRNTGPEAMKLYTVYAPAEHPAGTVHKTKAEAEAAERH